MPENDSIDKRRAMVRVQAGPLAAVLKDIASVVSRVGETAPILGNVLLSARDGMIELTATDCDLWLVTSIATDTGDWRKQAKDFTITLPAKSLAAIAAEADAQATIDIELIDGEPRAQVRYARSRFKLPTLPPDDFPPVPLIEVEAAFEIKASLMLDAMGAVDHAISTEETRYYLNGIYIHPQGLDLRLAATDGHRLARLTLDAPDGGASFPPDIIGKRTVALLEKLLGPLVKAADDDGGSPAMLLIESGGSKSRLRFTIGDIELVAKMIDGTYPDYARVIPTDTKAEAKIARGALISAIKRVRLLSSGKDSSVRATFGKDKIDLRVNSPENGEATDEVPCVHDGDEITIGFNGKYWVDVLEALATVDVVMAWNDPQAAVLVRGSGDDAGRFVQVIMPVRV